MCLWATAGRWRRPRAHWAGDSGKGTGGLNPVQGRGQGVCFRGEGTALGLSGKEGEAGGLGGLAGLGAVWVTVSITGRG